MVTGAGGGIGSAAARRFAEEGAKVVMVDVNLDAVNEAAEEINKDVPGSCVAVKADVSKSDDVKNTVKTCVDKFGRIDVYFANAGVLGKFVPIEEETYESFMRTLAINTGGGFLAIQHAAPEMKRTAGKGSIILTSSIASLRADLTPLQYAASKGALNAMMISANDRLIPHVRVNCIVPGGVMTNMAQGVAKDLDDAGLIMKGFDFEKFPHAEPEEIAALASFLASDESNPVRGAMIVADGGMSNSMGSQPPPVPKKKKTPAKSKL